MIASHCLLPPVRCSKSQKPRPANALSRISAKDLRLLKQRLATGQFVFLPTQQVTSRPTQIYLVLLGVVGFELDFIFLAGSLWELVFLDEECGGESRRDAEFDEEEDEHHGRAERLVGG